jgi:hypothetical protein
MEILMNPAMEILLCVLGITLSALLTLAITMLNGIRGDLKKALETQDDLSDRVLILENEHKNRPCTPIRA